MVQPIIIPPRLAKLRAKMTEQRYDAFFVVNESNVTYLSGYTNHDSFLFLSGTERGAANVFITDFRYTEQAAAECPDYEIMLYRNGAPGLPQRVQELCEKYGVKRLAFEHDHISYARYQELRRQLPDVELCACSGLPEVLRYVKDEAEGERLRLACAATDRVFEALCRFIRAGRTEREIEWELISQIRAQGCETGFDCIVVSGERGSLPHGVASDKVVNEGEFVTMDFGCLYQGYHADMTRTVMVGAPSAAQRKLYDTVLEAHLKSVAAIKAGASSTAVYQVARDIIDGAGYAGRFGHGLGHGVGLDIHENPFMGSTGEFTLKENCYLTVEPGIYIPGEGGVRIEDTVLVTATGHESLFRSTKELICL